MPNRRRHATVIGALVLGSLVASPHSALGQPGFGSGGIDVSLAWETAARTSQCKAATSRYLRRHLAPEAPQGRVQRGRAAAGLDTAVVAVTS